MLIYVVGYDAIEPNCVSGFDWYRSESLADEAYSEADKSNKIYQLTLNVIGGEYISSEVMTDKIEKYLDEHNYAGCWDEKFIDTI